MSLSKRHPPEELLSFLTRYPPQITDLFLAVRDNVLEVAPVATEIVTNASYTVASGFTFTHSIKQAFVYVGAYAGHVNLGFTFGSSLIDPEMRLKGDGKSMRHISIRQLTDADDPYLMELLQQAVCLAARPSEPLEPKTTITKMKSDAKPPEGTV